MQNIFPENKTPLEVLQMIHKDIDTPVNISNIFENLSAEAKSLQINNSTTKPTQPTKKAQRHKKQK